VPSTQKYPAGHGFSHSEVEASGHSHPALHLPEHAGFDKLVEAPYVPPGHLLSLLPEEDVGHQNP
jgi:hypothetical protein